VPIACGGEHPSPSAPARGYFGGGGAALVGGGGAVLVRAGGGAGGAVDELVVIVVVVVVLVLGAADDVEVDSVAGVGPVFVHGCHSKAPAMRTSSAPAAASAALGERPARTVVVAPPGIGACWVGALAG